MRIGSVTKTFTATAVLQLVDRKTVRLDDPIAKYVRGVPQGHRVTLRHLLGMRSGLAEYMADPDWGRAWATNPHRKWKPSELLPYAFKHSPESAPGTKYQYRNTNYVLLGMVVEKASGESLGSHLRHHVAEAARLRHTVLPKDAEFPAPNARGCTGDPVNDTDRPTPVICPRSHRTCAGRALSVM
ncbi:serine hydrolase domain-containing protein [Actinacidiphila sp. bgisy160]|uniref:serine hydrolase domain-containing protein n=1 Tax=Actinacidiphila sp. bgisy160 TaxID=3413796 RepID=UPI003D723A1C